MGGTLAGDEDIVAELSSIDPKVTESREATGYQSPGEKERLEDQSPMPPVHDQVCEV